MTRGRRRLAVCSAGHRMTDKNRRLKYYVHQDGSASLMSNGCRRCNAEKSREYHARNAVAIKLRRLGVPE